MSSVAVIEDLLKRRMGLHSATVGSGTVAQAVKHRMRDCDISDTQAYLKVLEHSVTELDALIDTVVIPETWFYRDRYPFAAFSAWVSDQWLPRHGYSQLRILSVPCSSGEEPYTLAMCLADLGLPAGVAHIDAADISHRGIEKARAASYSANSFRGNQLEFRERYFTEENQRYQLNDDIRHRVSLERANFLDEGFVQNRQSYHVIFCRNLLIYFDRPTQNTAISSLERLLSEEGVLFLGHSETNLLLERRFVPLGYTRCFAFRRASSRAGESSGSAHGPRAGRRRAPVRRQPHRPSGTPTPFSGTVTDSAPPPKDNPQLLAEAFLLADRGHPAQATRVCQTLLQRRFKPATVHYLLGLINESTGNHGDAEQHLRKAVYLDPNHYEALAHLGMMCRQRGDTSAAQRFEQRAARARRRRDTEETDT